MTKNDVKLLIGIIAIATVVFIGLTAFRKEAGEVVITVDGEVYGTYLIDEDQEIQINDTNQLVIQDGVVDMTHAECPDQICVRQREISKTGETIVCLPNKVIVEIIGAESAELDAVTN